MAAMLLATCALASSASAAAISGQIGEAWGEPGSSSGQLFEPAMLGVDPGDGSVFTGDVTPDGKHYRIQKFSGGGTFEASVEIPRIVEEKIVTLHGIAVDPVLHRLYVIEGCHLAKPPGPCKSFGSTYGARRVLVFSTEPHGTELVPAEGAATLPLPGGEETLYTPQTIAVDPNNHDLVVLAENTSGHATIQRISSTGVAGQRFVDTENALRPAGEEATSIAVGPTGTTYTLTGGPNLAGAEHTRAWELPPDLSSLTKIPGFAEVAESEGWPTGLLSPKSSPLLGGPQIAISPDGSTLYWKESLRQSTPSEAGEILIRGYSLTEGTTTVVYGGGKERCAITTSSAGLATTGEGLVVFDYGPEAEAPSYGDKVLTFGPGGSGCPLPVAKLKINDSEEATVTVQKGETVAFDATGSELLEGSPSELDWNFGDGSEAKVLGTPEEGGEPPIPAELTISHQYLTAGTFTVKLAMKLEGSAFGNPPVVERTVIVQEPQKPKFKLTVAGTGSGSGAVTSAPSGISCGTACEAEYEEGTPVTLTATPAEGSEFKGWSGACTGTGTCEVTMSAARSVGAEFALRPKFKLTVTNIGAGSGVVTSSPSGIACGAFCEAGYEEGTPVTLTATPAEGSEFKGWSGACTGTGTCEVTMSAARSVGAEFGQAPKLKVKLKVIESGPGIVTSSPSGVSCGAICERGYEKGETVTLTPIPAIGSEFKGWSGACTGTGTCEVTMGAAAEVTATFGTALTAPPVEAPPPASDPPVEAPTGSQPPTPKPKPKKSPLARCKKLKSRKRTKCIRHVRQGGH